MELPEGVTLQAARECATSALKSAGIAEAMEDATALLCHAAGIRPIDLMAHPGQVLDVQQRALFASCITRRLTREPVTRIIATRGFWDIDLHVAPDVLDPRADTETLINAAIELPGMPSSHRRILDLGCGSGAIACALLHAWPDATGIAIDVSEAACALTSKNALRCGVDSRLAVHCRSWGPDISGRFDLVVSNPPYIRSADIAGLDPEVRLWDPAAALDGGADGLDAYRELAPIVPSFLAKQGWLLLEIGYDQADDVRTILSAAGWDKISIFKDLSGHSRAIAATMSSDVPVP